MSLKLLALLPFADPVRNEYRQRLSKLEALGEICIAATLDEAAAAIATADILLAFGVHLRRDIFGLANRLKWVHALGTGVDGIVDAPSLRPDVIVTSTRGIHGASMSELAFLLMLSMARDFPRTLQAQQQSSWERWPAKLLSGKSVGILGVGLIAQALAPRCKAFDMRVVGFSRESRKVPFFDEVVPREALLRAAPELDFLIILIPLSAETRNIVSRDIIGVMKPTGFIINLARGGVIDEAALIEALDQRRLAGAALDTFVQEPLPPESPLWRARNLIVTPHIGGFFDTYPAQAVAQFAANLSRLAAGETELMINRER
jgi:phosphoglycerate dehydrogenase-like enzyme